MNEFKSLYGNLTTYGRKTGRPHTIELTYWHKDGKLHFLAHKRAAGSSTDWYHNLEHNPSCKFEVDGKVYNCKALSLQGSVALESEIRQAFEKKGGKQHYDSWYKDTTRIPVVVQIEG